MKRDRSDRKKIQSLNNKKKESNLIPRHGLSSLHSTDGSTWQGHTVNPLIFESTLQADVVNQKYH